MNDNDRLMQRLRSLGERPVERDLAAHHLTAILLPRRQASASRFSRVKMAAVFAAGLVLGGTSLASAGALGTAAQRTVADTVDGVGLDLPGGTARSMVGCDGEEVRNHGQFVSGGGDPHSECGKPVVSGAPEDQDPAGTPPDVPPCRPPWAGKGNRDLKTPEAVASHRAACGDDAAADEPAEESLPADHGKNSTEKPEKPEKNADPASEPATAPPVTPEEEAPSDSRATPSAPPAGPADDQAEVPPPPSPAPESSGNTDAGDGGSDEGKTS